jgi:FAD/FMN-containing dehydrogenase
MGLELTPETIALMMRVKQAFDPNGILNPGKIFEA